MNICSWCKAVEGTPRVLDDCQTHILERGQNMAVFLCDGCWTAYRYFDCEIQTEWRSTFIIYGDWMRLGA